MTDDTYTPEDFIPTAGGPCEGCREDAHVLYRLRVDANGALLCGPCVYAETETPDAPTMCDAERVGTIGIDVGHGCHRNAELGHIRAMLTEVADDQNREHPGDPVLGMMPHPVRVEEGADYAWAVFPDGSRLEWVWDVDGWVEAMNVYGPGRVVPMAVWA